MSNYREQFFEWVNKQPVYQDMPLQTKEMTLNLVDCWLNNNQAYIHYARLNGKDFAKRCAIDFCWFIKDKKIADLQHRLDVAEKALELAIETMRYELGRDAIKNLYKDAIKNLKENLNMKTDKEMSQWYLEQAESELKGE